jgi:hypothetical protein
MHGPMSTSHTARARPGLQSRGSELHCDRRAIPFLRTLVATLASMQRWCRFAGPPTGRHPMDVTVHRVWQRLTTMSVVR